MNKNKIIKFLRGIRLKDIIYWFSILVLLIFLSVSVNRCQDTKRQYMNNLKALNDSIHYYKGKNGNLVATIRGFESDLKTLELLNKDLYDHIDELKMKNKVNSAVYFEGSVSMPEVDTVYVVDRDTIYRGFDHKFNFNDKYRTLEGNVSYKDDSLGVKISKDIVNFDYTVGIDSKNNIYISSQNPYVKYESITGFQLPKQRTKRFSLGPSINFGYDPIQNKPSFSVGVSLNYGIIKF